MAITAESYISLMLAYIRPRVLSFLFGELTYFVNVDVLSMVMVMRDVDEGTWVFGLKLRCGSKKDAAY